MKIFLILILLINVKIYSQDINSLYNDYNFDSDEIVVISFEQINNCVKCVTASFSFVQELKSKVSGKICKHIVAIKCSREIELKIFKNQYEFSGVLILEKKSTKKDLGLDEDTKLAIFKNKKLILELSSAQLYDNEYSINNIIDIIK